MYAVIDNVTLAIKRKPPNEFYKANGKPFEYRGIIYSPKYYNAEIRCYEARLKNLRLYLYPDKMYLCNSIHKYSNGNNYSDFYLHQMREAFEQINDETGMCWNSAAVNKFEYGCNIGENAKAVIHSLQSYKGKNYLPMQHAGIIYGAACSFTDYKIKGYDKSLAVKHTDKINLNVPLFRWEVVINRIRCIEKQLQVSAPTLKDLLRQQTWRALSNEAVLKYHNSIKLQKMHLHKLSIEEKKILAVMNVPEIRDDVKAHHKRAFKDYKCKYKQILSNKSICGDDETEQALRAKFSSLITNKQYS